MTGGNILSIGESEYGIVPRAVQTIFETLQVKKGAFSQCEVKKKPFFSFEIESSRNSSRDFRFVFGTLQRRYYRSFGHN